MTNVPAAKPAAPRGRAEREADAGGWMVLVRPDGRRSVTAPYVPRRAGGGRARGGWAAAGPPPGGACEWRRAARCAWPPSRAAGRRLRRGAGFREGRGMTERQPPAPKRQNARGIGGDSGPTPGDPARAGGRPCTARPILLRVAYGGRPEAQTSLRRGPGDLLEAEARRRLQILACVGAPVAMDARGTRPPRPRPGRRPRRRRPRAGGGRRAPMEACVHEAGQALALRCVGVPFAGVRACARMELALDPGDVPAAVAAGAVIGASTPPRRGGTSVPWPRRGTRRRRPAGA
jgi:hypothetical protein